MSHALAPFLDLLACPDCRGALQLEASAEHGWLRCLACSTWTPVLHGMALFTETRSEGSANLDELARRLFGEPEDYESYQQDKLRRGLVDAYAAFEPFNEAGRCAPPMLNAARESMREGDAVLDLGVRGGWSTAMLAGIFPGQRQVSLSWTGSGVLGYRGFRRWFAGSARPSKLLQVFSPIDRPLPVANGAFALVHSHDCLHRAPFPDFLDDCLRAAAPDATLIHAHIHLADAEPEPFFERGGVIRPRKIYQDWLDTRLQADTRGGRVVAETAVYESVREGALDWPQIERHAGYNGFAFIAPASLPAAASERVQNEPLSSEARLLANPLLRINPLTGSVAVDPLALGGRAMEMLERHPPFAARLAKFLPATISKDDLELLMLAGAGQTLSELAARTHRPVNEMIAQASALVERELAIASPMAATYPELFSFHNNQRSVLESDLATALGEWAAAAPQTDGGRLLGGIISRQEAIDVISALVAFFEKSAVAPGDSLHFDSSSEDALWPLLACLVLGAKPVRGEAIAPGCFVVSDTPQPSSTRQLCVGEDTGAIAHLTEVLGAFLDPARGLTRRSSKDLGWRHHVALDGLGHLQGLHRAQVRHSINSAG